MTQLDFEVGHPAACERLSAKAVEIVLVGTLTVLQAGWLGLIGYGTWRLVFC